MPTQGAQRKRKKIAPSAFRPPPSALGWGGLAWRRAALLHPVAIALEEPAPAVGDVGAGGRRKAVFLGAGLVVAGPVEIALQTGKHRFEPTQLELLVKRAHPFDRLLHQVLVTHLGELVGL